MTLKECLNHILNISELNRQFFKEKQLAIESDNKDAFHTNIEYLVAYNHIWDLTKKWLEEYDMSSPDAETAIIKTLFYEYANRDFSDVHQTVLFEVFNVITHRNHLVPYKLTEFDESGWRRCVLKTD